VKIIETTEASFEGEFRRIRERKLPADATVEETVRAILADVREKGDEALFAYTERFDGTRLSKDSVEIPAEALDRALREIDGDVREVLRVAAERIERFHENQVIPSWRVEEDGAVMGQETVPSGAWASMPPAAWRRTRQRSSWGPFPPGWRGSRRSFSPRRPKTAWFSRPSSPPPAWPV